MLAEDWLTEEPLVVSPKTSVEEAIRTMCENLVRHLPVVRGKGTLVGIVTPGGPRPAVGGHYHRDRLVQHFQRAIGRA